MRHLETDASLHTGPPSRPHRALSHDEVLHSLREVVVTREADSLGVQRNLRIDLLTTKPLLYRKFGILDARRRRRHPRCGAYEDEICIPCRRTGRLPEAVTSCCEVRAACV
jgi:hypothetical protein